MPEKPRALLAAIVTMVAALVTGCMSEPQPVTRIGTNLWLGYEPLYVARSLGELPEQRVRLVEMPATTDVLHALRAGTLEGAALTLDEVLSLRAEGIDLRVVLALSSSNGADALIAAPGIDSLAQLQGKRVGYEPSAVGAVMLAAILEAGGLAPGVLELVRITPEEHVGSFRDGRVDAVVSYEPHRSRLLKLGGRELFSSKAIPERIIDVVAVRPEVLERSPERVALLRAAWYAAVAYQRRDPKAAMHIMTRRQQLDLGQLQRAFTGLQLADRADNRRLLAGPEPELLATARLLADILREQGLLQRPPPLADLFAFAEGTP